MATSRLAKVILFISVLAISIWINGILQKKLCCRKEAARCFMSVYGTSVFFVVPVDWHRSRLTIHILRPKCWCGSLVLPHVCAVFPVATNRRSLKQNYNSNIIILIFISVLYIVPFQSVNFCNVVGFSSCILYAALGV